VGSSNDRRPVILITQPDVSRADDQAIAGRKLELYRDAVHRAGGAALGIDELAAESARLEAFARMDGLLLSGGADIDPAVYGRPNAGSVSIQPGRDALERRAFEHARHRGVPVLGICRGLQAINAFSGGWLVQHVDGHAGAEFGRGPAHRHPVTVLAGSRLSQILGTDGVATTFVVNSYHHQGVRVEGLGQGLVAPRTPMGIWSRRSRRRVSTSWSASSVTRSAWSPRQTRSAACSRRSSRPPPRTEWELSGTSVVRTGRSAASSLNLGSGRHGSSSTARFTSGETADGVPGRRVTRSRSIPGRRRARFASC
jgi:putative glutamine amidotransferase